MRHAIWPTVIAAFSLSFAIAGCGANPANTETGSTGTSAIEAREHAPNAPGVGDEAKDFSLKTLDGKEVTLAELRAAGRVVLVQLRGWVGSHCPACTTQVGDLIAHADDIKGKGAQVVLLYPGLAEDLDAHARDFLQGKEFPDNMHFVLDPDLTFVNEWGLRWDADGETAYPATFVVDTSGKITFANISDSHRGRVTAEEVLAAL